MPSGQINPIEAIAAKRGINATRLALSTMMAAHLSVAAAFAQTAPATEVYVLATLYGRHATTPAYGHATLREVIIQADPDVVVLDVSPEELRRQTVTPSKTEYPEVIFPLVREHAYRAYAGEPDEPEFTEIVSNLSDALRRFREERPQQAMIDQAYNEATYAALAEVWHTPADVNSALTDQLLAARRSYQDRMAGPKVAQSWRRWNEHTVEVVRTAIRENPGKRVLVLIGVENCAQLRPALRNAPEVQLVDVEAWLRRAVDP
jgi:hypothetical protein